MYVWEGQDGDPRKRDAQAAGSAGNSSRYPQRPGPAGGPEAPEKRIRLQLSATRPAWNRRAGDPSPQWAVGSDFLPTPRQRPQHSGSPSGHPSGLWEEAPGRQHAGHHYTGGTEGEAKKGEKGRHFHGREDQIWGGERTGKTRKFKKEPLLPPWLTFPVSPPDKKRKETLLFPP